jgi:hypothetical protein
MQRIRQRDSRIHNTAMRQAAATLGGTRTMLDPRPLEGAFSLDRSDDMALEVGLKESTKRSFDNMQVGG